MTRVTGVGVDVMAGDTPIMDARDLVDHMLDKRGIRMTIGSAPCATFDLQFRQDFAALIESRDAKIRAEERERCADRADKWLHETFEVEEIVDDVETTLRAAIMQNKENT
jgi:hypothetical protein